MKRKNIKEHGITLVALVITIVVLIILAAVAINLTLGNNGIFTRAKTAKEQYQNAEAQEKFDIAKASNEIDKYVDGNRDAITIKQEDYNKIMEKINGLGVQTTQLSNIANGVTLTSNIIRKSGNVVYINIRGSYNKEFKSADLIIGNIPEGYRPTESIVSTCNASNGEYMSEDSSYLYIGPNGNIQIRNNKSTDYRYFHICESFIFE